MWIHESARVFHDRLINEEDRLWFNKCIVKQLFLYFKLEWKLDFIFNNAGMPMLYGDFMKRGLEPDQRVYEEIKEYSKLSKIISDYQDEETKLNMVLFKDCMEHITRIARVLRQERGHMLLVGVGGSGKKSLTTLASVLANCELKSLEPKKNYGKAQFKEDLFELMKLAATSKKQISFLFADVHILQESFLEDINNLINSGEIPGLIGRDEMDQINAELADEAKKN